MTLFASRWGFAIIGGSLLTALLGVFAFNTMLAGVRLGVVGLLTGGAGGGILTAIALLDRRTRVIRKDVRKGILETRAMTNIRPLLENGPLDVGGWALPAETCERLVHEIRTRRPKTIVECGSGASTVLMAACLRTYGIDGKIISLDHEATYAQSTRDQLQQQSLSQYATVVTAPLSPLTVAGKRLDWYDFDPDEHLEATVDLLLVDGPPWDTGEMARFPAVPVLKQHLSSDCFILLDDGKRSDETKVAEEWGQMLQLHEAKLSGNYKPFWTFVPRA